jgi:non-canonical purine NTP pyrophosphatase (RdgB/HAM1 family)
MKITFVTGNSEKLREVREILNDMEIVGENIDLNEIQELDGKKVAISKAELAYGIIKKPLIVEDTSLYIKSWKGLPGTFNKWFMKTVGNEGILKMLSGFGDKSATAETVIVYKDDASLKIFDGITEGSISETIRGENGFGWDKIFVPKGSDKTQAELTASEKNGISSRRKALEKLKKYLKIT